ncbi:MAG TPA: DUF6787 family protein [Flavobacterium sp.]|jgi:hypothetical protein|nr:DUF6787 family protein [Flavobacterium sp.]
MNKLKQRWGITSNFQLTIIFIVFAITGSSSAILAELLMNWFGWTKQNMNLWLYWPLRIILIFPAYQVLLVFFGFVFGQFKFFWNFEKKMLRSMGLGFLLPQQKTRD